MSSKEELRILLDELELYGYNRKRLLEEIDYSEDTIRKALRKNPSEKLFNKIKGVHQRETEKAKNPINQMYEELKQVRAELHVTRIMVADALAAFTNQPGGVGIMAKYDKLIEQHKKDV